MTGTFPPCQSPPCMATRGSETGWQAPSPPAGCHNRSCLRDLAASASNDSRSGSPRRWYAKTGARGRAKGVGRSEEHTSELQSQSNLVCRLLLEKKKTKIAHSARHTRTAKVRPTK